MSISASCYQTERLSSLLHASAVCLQKCNRYINCNLVPLLSKVKQLIDTYPEALVSFNRCFPISKSHCLIAFRKKNRTQKMWNLERSSSFLSPCFCSFFLWNSMEKSPSLRPQLSQQLQWGPEDEFEWAFVPEALLNECGSRCLASGWVQGCLGQTLVGVTGGDSQCHICRTWSCPAGLCWSHSSSFIPTGAIHLRERPWWALDRHSSVNKGAAQTRKLCSWQQLHGRCAAGTCS